METFRQQTLLLVSDLQQLDLEDWKGLGFTLGVRKALMEAVEKVEIAPEKAPSNSHSIKAATNVTIDPVTGLIIGNIKDGRIALNPITNEICHVDDYSDLAPLAAGPPRADEEPVDPEEYILSPAVWTQEQMEADEAFRERLQLFYSLFNPDALQDGTIDSHVENFRGREHTCMEILNKRYVKALLEQGDEVKVVSPKPSSDTLLKAGDRVVVRGLTLKKQYNGLVGNVVELCNDGRVAVKLLEGTKTIAVDPSNLLYEATAGGVWLDERQPAEVTDRLPERPPDRGAI